MNDNQETSADIIAEMRRRIAMKMSDAWYTQEEWRKLCDRLEAACKRERGDVAKLREAVVETQSVIAKCMGILNRIPDSCGYGGLIDDVADELCALREDHIKPTLAAPATAEKSSAVGDAAKLREALETLVDLVEAWEDHLPSAIREEEVSPALDKSNAALATPPRNCDMQYSDRAEMFGAFNDWCNARGHTMEPKLAYDAFEWLLALTTEKEGDSNGK